MAAPVHFPILSYQIRAQNHERKNTSAKSRGQNHERKSTSAKIRAQFYEHKTRNSIFWQFRGNYMLGNSWKLYAGKFLEIYAGKFLETICWKIRVDAGCFLKGVIMAQCWCIILRFQGSGTRGSVEHPSSADLSRIMHSEASEVIGSVEQGMGIWNPSGSSVRTSWWASATASKWIRRL